MKILKSTKNILKSDPKIWCTHSSDFHIYSLRIMCGLKQFYCSVIERVVCIDISMDSNSVTVIETHKKVGIIGRNTQNYSYIQEWSHWKRVLSHLNVNSR